MTTTETPETETDPANEPDPTPEPSPETETAKQLEHWKEQAKKQEQRAKANAAAAKELEQVKASMMSDTEKAVAEAKAAGLAEGLRTGSAKIAQAEIRAAAAGRSVDVDALLEGVDASRFIDDDGEVNRQAITQWVDKVAPSEDPSVPRPLDLGQGNRGGRGGSGEPRDEFAKFLQGQLKR